MNTQTVIRDETDMVLYTTGAEPLPKRSLLTGGDPDAPAFVPDDQRFEENETDFLPANEIERIGQAVMAAHPDIFGHLVTAEIVFVWKRKGGKSCGKSKLAFCQKTSGMTRYFARADFVIWIAADTAKEYCLTNWQIEACVFHELLHADVDEETGKPATRRHDFEGFAEELQVYGCWQDDLFNASQAFAQAALPGIR